MRSASLGLDFLRIWVIEYVLIANRVLSNFYVKCTPTPLRIYIFTMCSVCSS